MPLAIGFTDFVLLLNNFIEVMTIDIATIEDL